MGLNKKKMALMAAATATFVSTVLPVGTALAYKDGDYAVTDSGKDGGSYRQKGEWNKYLYNYWNSKTNLMNYKDQRPSYKDPKSY